MFEWEEARWSNSDALGVWSFSRMGRSLLRHLCPLTCVTLSAREAGAVVDQAKKRKTEKYAHLSVSHHFMPFAVETSSVFGSEALSLLDDVDGRIRAETGEPRSFQFLLQGISVAIQRGNTVLSTAHVIDNVFI